MIIVRIISIVVSIKNKLRFVYVIKKIFNTQRIITVFFLNTRELGVIKTYIKAFYNFLVIDHEHPVSLRLQ